MTWTKIPCPDCGSPQEFKPKTRRIAKNRHETYVKCLTCKRERVLDILTDTQMARIRRAKRQQKK